MICDCLRQFDKDEAAREFERHFNGHLSYQSEVYDYYGKYLCGECAIRRYEEREEEENEEREARRRAIDEEEERGSWPLDPEGPW